MTVGELRKILDGVSDETVVLVYADESYPRDSYHIPSIFPREVGQERFLFEPKGNPQSQGTPYILII